ncbi:MAG TPA: methyl-accepting chemotaxis protein [Usitatibacter sp.]|jgi:methyl-accepting chemotaxis protein-1 (serine sensor receptor)
MKLKTKSLQFKVLLLMSVALAIALAVSVLALTRVYGSIQELDRISREDFETQQSVLRATIALKQQVQDWKDVLLRGHDAESVDALWKTFVADEKDVADTVREARSATPHEDVRAALEKFLSSHKAAGETYRKGLEAFKDSKFDPRAGDKATEGVSAGPSAQLSDIEKVASEWGARATAQAVSSAENGYRVAIVGTITALVGALVALWVFFRRAVLAPMAAAARFAERIAQGDLTGRISSRSEDEAGQLVGSLGRMNLSLAEVVSKVRSSANNVASASMQVAAGTTDLSQRTEEQASSLEETAASMEELASTVRQNAENAKEADELARNAAKRAEQGGGEVSSAVVTMNEISKSAQRIADITSVIDAIAFQTNILALNAAVEAARAGEQGRGFAVVAAEVRSLAQRSAQAAKEIKDLISHSVDEVRNGTTQVEQAGGTIQALVVDVQRVSALMNQIAEASAEQSRGVQQVNKTVTQMDKVVQENASAVQQSAAAAQGMKQQAEMLVEAVSAFAVDGSHAPAAPAPRAGRNDFARREPEFAPGPATMIAKAAGTKPGPLPKLAATASTAGDDWEEF